MCSKRWYCLYFCMRQRHGQALSKSSDDCCLPNEMLAGHCWSDSEALGEKLMKTIFADTGEVPVEAQLKLRRLQWFGHLRRMPEYQPHRQVLKCHPQGKNRKPRGTSLHWLDVVNSPKLQEPVQDRSRWRSTLHQVLLSTTSMYNPHLTVNLTILLNFQP